MENLFVTLLSRRILIQQLHNCRSVTATSYCSKRKVPVASRFSFTPHLTTRGLSSSSKLQKKTVTSSKSEEDGEETSPQSKEDSSSSPKNVVHRDHRRDTTPATTPSPLDEAKQVKRYERDLPPVEEERHKHWKSKPLRSVNKNLIRTDLFEKIDDKTKDSFHAAIEIFSQRDIHLRGHVEFIYACLNQMIKFGVHRDLDTYKKIIDIFPKGKMIASNMFQVEFMHYPKQQQCGIDILEQMEHYGVIPDSEVQQMLINIFGSQSFPMRKSGRMLYWMPKFKNLSPWLLPDPLPDHAKDLAIIAIKRITSVDLSTKIDVHEASELDDATDLTWIVSGQSQEQCDLIAAHPAHTPIYVEGAFRVWLQRTCINYFILRAEPKPKPEPKKTDPDDVSQLPPLFSDSYSNYMMETIPSVHEQEDGIILGVVATGTSSRDSLLSWIRFLERTNPRLASDIPVLFTLTSPIGPTDALDIPAFPEADRLKELSSSSSFPSTSEPPPFSVSSGGTHGPDVHLPNLRQMGIWTESETVFPNWPHAHHPPDSPSAINLAQNLAIVDELEEHVASRRERVDATDQLGDTKPTKGDQLSDKTDTPKELK